MAIQGITQTELARILDVGKVALGGLIDRLEKRGYVERRADGRDRRVNRVFPTIKSREALERMTTIGMDMNAKVMRGISLDRQNMLAQTLHYMKDNLIALHPVARAEKDARD